MITTGPTSEPFFKVLTRIMLFILVAESISKLD